MAQPPQIIKDATDAVASTAALGTGAAALLDIISVGIALVVGVLSIVVLLYSIRLRRREWRRGKSK